MGSEMRPKKLGYLLVICQIVFLTLFGAFAVYGKDADAKQAAGPENDAKNSFQPRYAMFQDIHIMIFVGFGFLMTFLKRYGFGSSGFNFLLAAITIEWVILCQGIKYMLVNGVAQFPIDLKTMITGDFGAAAVLISFGVVLGKASHLQLVIMVLFEIPFYALNAYLVQEVYRATDTGGSITIHTFGAYFGLACSLIFQKKWQRGSPDEGSVYHSDLFAMIGTLFLWVCWPSFNAGLLVTGEEQHRAAVNTYLSLVACVVMSFSLSNILSDKGKLDMVHIQNATLAGGVAVGTVANFMLEPWAAITIGIVAGVISVLGYVKLTPFLAERLGLHDTCGVNNLHGMPGIISGVAGIVAAAVATENMYGSVGLGVVFPDRSANLTNPRSASDQAGFQAAGLLTTIGIAVVAGLMMGFLLRKLNILDSLDADTVFHDDTYWEVPDGYLSEKMRKKKNYQTNVYQVSGNGMVDKNGDGKTLQIGMY